MTREERFSRIQTKALAGPPETLCLRFLNLMEHRSVWIRCWALDQLRELGPLPARIGARLGAVDSDMALRDDAVTLLGEVGTRSDAHLLLMAARDPEWMVRCSAMSSLSRIGGTRAYKAVVKGLRRDRHPVVRAWAATALSSYPGAQPVLEQAMEEEEDPHARVDIVNSLIVLGRRDLIPELATFLTDDWHATRYRALDAIRDLSAEDRAPLMPALKAAIEADMFHGGDREVAERMLAPN